MNKICIDARMIDSSGIGTYIKALLPMIIEKHHVILLGDTSRLKEYGCKVIEVASPIYSLKEQFELPKKIPYCDIFWSPHYNVPVFPIRAKKRLVTIHDVFHLAFADQLTFAQRCYAKIMLSRALKISDAVITVSKFSKSEIIKYCSGIYSSKIKVVYNGVNIDRFSTLGSEDVCRKYDLPEKYLLCVGNIKAHKNLGGLLRTVEALSVNKNKDLNVVIVGDRDKLRTSDDDVFNIVSRSPVLSEKVFFTGYVEDEDLSAIYQRAHLFVFPSKYEGFGLPPLEAMAAGCPVISSNVASMPEVCGEAVDYFNPFDENSMAQVIDYVWRDENLRLSLVKRGRQRVKLFGWDISRNYHMDILNTLC